MMNDRKLLEALVSKYGKTTILNEISLATARSAANKAKELGRTKQERRFEQYRTEKEKRFFDNVGDILFEDGGFIPTHYPNDMIQYGILVIGQDIRIPAFYSKSDGVSIAIDEDILNEWCRIIIFDELEDNVMDEDLMRDFDDRFATYFKDLLNRREGYNVNSPVHFIEDLDYFFKQLKNTCDNRSTARELAKEFVELCNDDGISYKDFTLGEQLADWHYYARL